MAFQSANGKETAYRRQEAGPVARCQVNNLSLTVDKTKEMITDPMRRRKKQHTPIYVGETEAERVKTFQFLFPSD